MRNVKKENRQETNHQKITGGKMNNLTGRVKMVITGTQAYGPTSLDSDWDIVMCYWDAEQLKQLLVKENVKIDDSSSINPIYLGFCFNIFGTKIQIICANNDEDLTAWEKATEAMRKKSPIADRKTRITQFQRFYNFIKNNRHFIPEKNARGGLIFPDGYESD